MDKKNKTLLIILSLILISSIVNADHTLTYDNYMEVNISELIALKDGDLNDDTGKLFIDNSVHTFIWNNVTNQLELYITETIEKDTSFFIQLFNETITPTVTNSSDNTREGFITINDQTIYGFKINHSINHTINETHNHDICPFIRSITGTPKLKAVIGVPNGTDIMWSISDEQEYDIITYNSFCMDIPHRYLIEINETFEEYSGFYCTNCGVSNTIRLGTDTTLINNKSFTAPNTTANINNITNITTANYIITNIELDDQPHEEYFGIFKFRIPFYINISIIDNYNTTFNPIFNYLYLRDSTIQSETKYADLGSSISNILTFGYFDRTTVDYTETFWTELNTNSQGQIKLYEKGNYSITMLTLKTFKPGIWPYEFYKPQYTDNKVETTLDSKLQITEEINQNVLIQASEYELNKASLIFNIVKWVFFIIIGIAGIIVSFYTPNPMVSIATLLTLILPIIYKVLF